MALAAFFVQAHPPAFAGGKVILKGAVFGYVALTLVLEKRDEYVIAASARSSALKSAPTGLISKRHGSTWWCEPTGASGDAAGEVRSEAAERDPGFKDRPIDDGAGFLAFALTWTRSATWTADFLAEPDRSKAPTFMLNDGRPRIFS